jgi:endogenous inhibitor of DNA gyrase (YacG/DUF329 family)
MNITGDIEFCVMCENPDTRLEPDDFDFCKRCKIKEMRNWAEENKKLASSLIQQIPEAQREQIVKAAYSSIR